jgi:hypothetical protein
MKKVQILSKVNADRIYPFLCTKFQIYFNRVINTYGPDVTEYKVEQDLIDYSYMVNPTPPVLIPLFHQILKPSPPVKNSVFRLLKKIRLFLRYERFFIKKINPSLIRVNEKMVLIKDKRKSKFKKLIVKRTEKGVECITDPNIFWPNEDFKYLRGKKLKSTEYINCEFKGYTPNSL